jgi:hypothetical protein
VAGGLRFAFYGRISTPGYQDAKSSHQWQRENAVRLIAGTGTVVRDFFDAGCSRSLDWAHRPALLPTALLIGATVLLSTVTIWLDGTRGSNTWLTLGALWALLFLAIGALTASYHYQRMLMEARTSLIVAERRARDHYDTAIRGRALAAAIYADENHRSEEADRYARIARQIFSDPTPPRARTHDQP